MGTENELGQDNRAEKPRFESVPSEFGLDGDGIHRDRFSDSNVDDEDDLVIVVTESGASSEYSGQLRYFRDRDRDKVKDEDEETSRIYSIKVFVSTSAQHLSESYEATEPGRNELCVFVEDNRTDSISSTYASMKMGSSMSRFLSSRETGYQEAAESTRNLLLTEMGIDLNLSEAQFTQLLDDGYITNVSSQLLILLFQIFNASTIITTPVFEAIAGAISAVTTFLREEIKIPDSGWDPAAKLKTTNEAGEPIEVENTEFSPFLIPVDTDLLDVLENGADDLADKIGIYFAAQGLAIKEKIKEETTWDIPLIGEVDLAPEEFKAFIERAYEYFESALDIFLDALRKIGEMLTYVGEKILNIINAVYCGIWNSLVEAVLGIIDLIGLLFNLNAKAGKFLYSAQENIPKMLELIDEGIQSLQDLNFQAILDEILIQIQKVNFPSFTYSINIEKIAYFYGAFLGFIIEIIIETLITAGPGGVVAIFTKIGTVGSRLSVKVTAGLTEFFGKSMAQLGDDVLLLLSKIIELFRKGKDEMITIIRRFFDDVKSTIKLADGELDEVLENLPLNKADADRMAGEGLYFVRQASEEVADDLVGVLCKIDRAVPG